jgi:hypothetical protein
MLDEVLTLILSFSTRRSLRVLSTPEYSFMTLWREYDTTHHFQQSEWTTPATTPLLPVGRKHEKIFSEYI